ncbi:MAG TPA: TlpA disulfide reductase family protein [Candidatus Eisenbacteria bacterium]|nr:TlpA disulfide reductase family protein [Candidatus Eisenbacteria bacterium]
MKTNLAFTLAAALLISAGPAFAADKPNAKSELQLLVSKVQTQIKLGKKTEKDLAAELKEFDALLTSHKDEKTDDVAQILFMKALLYVQVFDDAEKGVPMLKQIKTDFPDSTQAKQLDKVLASIEKQAESKKAQSGLVEGVKFPDFDEKDIAGKPLSIAKYKGKVVLVDFWATWCGPCVGELPNVLNTYGKYHGKGFEIVGISLDQEEKKLTDFTTEKKMPWQQFFDGKGWGNKLAVKYGVNSIPATYLLDGEGKIIAKNLRGPELEAAVAKALGSQ